MSRSARRGADDNQRQGWQITRSRKSRRRTEEEQRPFTKPVVNKNGKRMEHRELMRTAEVLKAVRESKEKGRERREVLIETQWFWSVQSLQNQHSLPMKKLLTTPLRFHSRRSLSGSRGARYHQDRPDHRPQRQAEREGRRLSSHFPAQRREGRCRWMDNAAVHGTRHLGCVHKGAHDRSDGDGRHRSCLKTK